MADSNAVVVRCVLCFIQTQDTLVPTSRLREVVIRGFKEEEVSHTEDLIFELNPGCLNFRISPHRTCVLYRWGYTLAIACAVKMAKPVHTDFMFRVIGKWLLSL